MPTYDVKVIVEYNYEVEAETPELAEEQGWDYDEHSWTGEVYSIEADEQIEEEEVSLDEEVI